MLLLHMYDDRGLDITAASKKPLLRIYNDIKAAPKNQPDATAVSTDEPTSLVEVIRERLV